MNHRHIPLAIVIAASLLHAQLTPPLLTLPDSTQQGLRIQRTMRLLTTNKPVKIVAAGQSIIDGMNPWITRLMDTLKVKFNNNQISFLNTAVGACATDCQLGTGSDAMGGTFDRTTPIAAATPDLVIYYVYGWENYDEILNRIDQKCTNDSLEYLILNAHPTPPDSNIQSRVYGMYMKDYFLPWMCEKHNAAICDIYTPWEKYLADYNKPAQELLLDNVHLNPAGQLVMEDLVERYFVVRGPDTKPPRIDTLISKSPTRIRVVFNETIDKISATVAANYTVTGTSVVDVLFCGDLRSVFLRTSPRQPGPVTVTVVNVKDIAGNPAVAGTSSSFTPAAVAEWQSRDIGQCAAPGSTVQNGSAFTLVSKADNTGAYKNELQYAWKTVYGDFQIVGRLNSQQTAEGNAMSGLAARESDEYYAKGVFVGLRQSGKISQIIRPSERGLLTDIPAPGTKAAPIWFKITRVGTATRSSFSADGTTWTPGNGISTMTSYEATVGMYTVAGKYNLTSTATFDNITVTSQGPNTGTVMGAAVPGRMAAFSAEIRRNRLILRNLPSGENRISIVNAAGRVIGALHTIQRGCIMPIPANAAGACVIRVRTAAGTVSSRVVIR